MTLYQWIKSQGLAPQKLVGKKINLLKLPDGSKRPEITSYNYDNMGKVIRIDKWKLSFENGGSWSSENISDVYTESLWSIQVINSK